MDDEKLIECVRKYEFLYNLKHPKYMDNVRKEIAWDEIAGQLKKSAAACKQRWQVLRDACRRALNKRKGKSGQEVRNIKKWKYEDEMSFVIPFFVERKPHDTTEIPSDDEGFENEYREILSNTSDYLGISANNTPAVNIVNTKKTLANTGYTEIGDDERIKNNNIKSQGNQTKKNVKAKIIKRAKLRSVPSPSVISITRLLEKYSKVEPQRGHDELDRFFLNISETVKKFPLYGQALAKNKIFTIISEMELQQLAPSLPNASTSPQSTSTKDIDVYDIIPKLEIE